MRLVHVVQILLVLAVAGCFSDEWSQATKNNENIVTRNDAVLEPPSFADVPNDVRPAAQPAQDGIVTGESAVSPSESDPYLYGYDPQTTADVRGQVLNIADVGLENGDTGVILVLQPGGDMIYLFAGEKEYLARHGITFGITDRVAAKGSRIEINGRPTVLAEELTVGDKTIRVRAADGQPLWLAYDSDTERSPAGK